MAIIETKRLDIQRLQGVHLFHFATSNCSQRVRLALEEKSVPWESHHINLGAHENATPEFIALNPNGVVPVLVHDGTTIVESNDIIRYVDEEFEGPALSPTESSDIDFLMKCLASSSGFQDALKVITYEFLFKPFRRMDEQQLSEYAEGTKNSALVRFMREFSSEEGFGRDRILSALQETESVLNLMETRLGDCRCNWISGEEFGLADISWVPNFYRFLHLQYPIDRFERVSDWLARVQMRKSFENAIGQFESEGMSKMFQSYSEERRESGSSVGDYLQEIV